LSLCFNAFSSVPIWLSCLSAVTTVLLGIDNASFVKISSGFKPRALTISLRFSVLLGFRFRAEWHFSFQVLTKYKLSI